jgi:hypothetical protein
MLGRLRRSLVGADGLKLASKPLFPHISLLHISPTTCITILSTHFSRQCIPVLFSLECESSSIPLPFTLLARKRFLAMENSASLITAPQKSSHHLNFKSFTHVLTVSDRFWSTSLTRRLNHLQDRPQRNPWFYLERASYSLRQSSESYQQLHQIHDVIQHTQTTTFDQATYHPVGSSPIIGFDQGALEYWSNKGQLCDTCSASDIPNSQQGLPTAD